MTAPLITVDLLVCRRDSPHPEPGPLDDLARVGSRAAMGRRTDQVFVKAEVEIDPLHLAIGDSIEPCPQLVVDGQPHGVANRFLPIDRAEKVGMRATSP